WHQPVNDPAASRSSKYSEAGWPISAKYVEATLLANSAAGAIRNSVGDGERPSAAVLPPGSRPMKPGSTAALAAPNCGTRRLPGTFDTVAPEMLFSAATPTNVLVCAVTLVRWKSTACSKPMVKGAPGSGRS